MEPTLGHKVRVTIDDHKQLPPKSTLGVGELNVKFSTQHLGTSAKLVNVRGSILTLLWVFIHPLTKSNSGGYLTGPLCPAIALGNNSAAMNASSGASKGHKMPCSEALVKPKCLVERGLAEYEDSVMPELPALRQTPSYQFAADAPAMVGWQHGERSERDDVFGSVC